MPNSRLRSRLLLAAIAFSIVPLLLLVAELVVRLFAKPIDPLSVFVTSPQLQSDTQGESTAGLFEFDPALTWRLRANLPVIWWDFTPVRTNGAHLRVDREIGPKSGLRILCLGDSVTFGYRVPVAPDRNQPAAFDAAEKSYPVLLEEILRQNFPGKNIEVLPMACPGYTSGQGAAWLERDLSDLKADIVTACFGWNDVRAAGLPDRMTFPSPGAQVTVRKVIAHSQLLLQLAKSAQSAKAAQVLPSHAEPRSSAQEYIANFDRMRTTSQQHGAWFGIILPVYRDPNTPGDYPEGPAQTGAPDEGRRIADYREQLRVHALQTNTPHLLIPELIETAWPGNQSLFGERIHPNAAGHKLMAERLAAFLLPAVSDRLR
jgi:lysophospholipase L1-like esterase